MSDGIVTAVLGSGTVIASIVVLISNIVIWKLNRKAAKDDKNDDLIERVGVVESELLDMKNTQNQRHDEIIRLLNTHTEGSKAAIRNAILTIYHAYLPVRELPVYQRENLELLCDSYFQLGGNSFVKTIKDEMDEWTSVSEAPHTLEETA